ncbi:MAG: efflux RND transporter periplasmic adaptor subunit [Pseudomonadota bacterium]|nr:efflux RND transporter periplasmic adaptor subunit [Pseudomonadota bacterium]
MRAWRIGVVAVLVLAGIGYWVSRPERVAVTLLAVERGAVERTVANTRAGTVEACQRAKLSMPIGGQIERLLVTEGDHVEEGQLMMALWNHDRAARLGEAKAALVSATRESESLCIASRSDQREARRIAGLAERKLVAQESADLARARADASAAGCEAGKARQMQAEAAVNTAEALLAQTELKAPFAGIVADVTGELGEYVTPSPPGIPTPPAIDLITDDCHYVSAPIDEVDASEVAVGMPVRVSLDAFRDRSFPARVTRIAPYVVDYEKQARTVEVEAEIDDLPDDIQLLTGYSADMEIILDRGDNALRIPSEVILDGRFVLVVGSDGRLEKREITTGLANWRHTEVTAGLAPGEQVVANVGSAGVVEGARADIGDGAPAGDG